MAKIKPLQPKEVLARHRKYYEFETQALIREPSRNKNSLHILATCPQCNDDRWVRVSAIRCGAYSSPLCCQCVKKVLPLRPYDVAPQFQEYYDFEMQKVIRRRNSNKGNLHILTTCPECREQRWAEVSAIRHKRRSSPLCAHCAGLDNLDHSLKYTDQELIRILQNRAGELGRTPKTYEMRKPHHGTYRTRFGSWYAALKMAGFPDDEMPKCKGSPPYEYGQPPRIDDDLGYFLAGFVAGEGCFCVSRGKNETNRFGYGFCPYFRINLNERDLSILQTFQKVLGCGRVSPCDKLFRHFFVVHSIRDLVEKVIPFFRQYDFRETFKQKQFEKWCHVIELLNCRAHLERDGFEMVYKLAGEINTGFRSSAGLEWLTREAENASQVLQTAGAD